MSRISGLFLSSHNHHRQQLVQQMLKVSSYNPNWINQDQSSGRVTIGWTGWHSPNMTEVNDVLVVMDGYIYNREYLGRGNKNDAELVASLYQKYGFAKTLTLINGDFAIAVYDSKIDTLWLGRDRFGIKPLYYHISSGQCAFASQLRSLLTLPNVSREVNRQFVALFAACHYRYFDNNPEASPYADIKQLPAAHLLSFQDGKVTTSAYWQLQDLPDFTDSETELAQQYRDLLLDSVSLRLKSAHNQAFTLSGGMDSSSVLACAVKITGEKQHAFSTVYADKTYDESEEISSMLETKVQQWHPVEIGNPDIFDLVRQIISIHDEPVATATWLSHFLLCQQVAQQGFGSLFGGLGGDELNAGEYEYFWYHFADLYVRGEQEEFANEVSMWAKYHDHPIFRKNMEIANKGLAELTDLSQPGKCLPDLKRLRRYRNVLNPDYFDLDTFQPVMEHPFSSYLKNRTYQDIFRETAPCCLRAEDRQTVALGIDHFLPFFDYKLVEFMYRIPGSLKIREGVTKILLREATRGILPEATRTRVKKVGWNAPAHLWFSGKGKEQLQELVHSHSFRQRGIYNAEEIDRLIQEHDYIVLSGEPKENHMMFLWQLINLEFWLQSV